MATVNSKIKTPKRQPAKRATRERKAASFDTLPDVSGEAVSDLGNARALYAAHGQQYLYVPAWGWLAWTGTHWKRCPDDCIRGAAVEMLQQRAIAAIMDRDDGKAKAALPSARHAKDAVELFRPMVLAEPDDFDNAPDLLNVANGVLDLKTGYLTPQEPRQRFTYCVAVPYNPQADMEPWQAFLRDVTQNASEADYLQTVVGYMLSGSTREERMWYLTGPGGSGKGTFTEALLTLMPDPIGVEVDFTTFTARRDGESQGFDLAGLKSARLLVASESNKYQSLNPAKVKALTGGDMVRCAEKHKPFFTYRPQYKCLLVSNHDLNADAEDNALWDRVEVIEFPVRRRGTDKADPQVKARFKLPQLQEGILRWAVEGAMYWYAKGRLMTPQSVHERTHRQRALQDYTAQWLEDCCALQEGAWASSAALMASYREWCESNNVKPQAARELAHTLVKRFGCVGRRAGAHQARGYDGIKLESA